MSKLLKTTRRPTEPTAQDGSMSKWTKGIGHHKPKQTASVNVKFLPLRLIKPDQDNARLSVLSDTDIQKVGAISLPFDEMAQVEFETALENFYKNAEGGKQKFNEHLSIAHLAASIASPEGLKQPVVVTPCEGEFNLIFGHRRRLAHLLLDAEHILCKIEDDMTDELDYALTQFKENNDREDLDLISELRAINRIIKGWETTNQTDISISKLMALTNQKKTKTAWQLAVIRLMREDSQFSMMIEQGKVKSLQIAHEIASISDKSTRKEVINHLSTHDELSFDTIKALIKSSKRAVRSPDSNKKSLTTPLAYGLKITKKSDLEPLRTMLNSLINSDLLHHYQSELKSSDTSTPEGLADTWQKIYDIIKANCPESGQ